MNKLSCLWVIFFLVACGPPPIEETLNYDTVKLMDVMEDLYVAGEVVHKMDPELRDSMDKVMKAQIEIIHGVNMDSVVMDLHTLTQYPNDYTEAHKMVRDSLLEYEKKDQCHEI